MMSRKVACMVKMANMVRRIIGAAACVLTVTASLTAGAIPAYASGAGGGGDTGGGNSGAANNIAYVWHDGGGYDINGKMMPDQGWNRASADNFLSRLNAVIGVPITQTGVDGTGEKHIDKYYNAADQALRNARARAGTTDARVIGVGCSWFKIIPTRYAFSHHEENTFRRLLPRMGNASELPSANGWGGEFQTSGKNWRQHAYDQAAADNPGGDYSVVVVAVADTEPAAYGTLEVNKTETDADVVVNNVNYSLENTEFGIYRDQSCTQLVTTLTTDASGRGRVQILAGTYYMKEIDPPVGHISSDGVWTLTITPSNTTTQRVEEEAVTVDVDVTKIIEGTDGGTLGDVSLAGARVRLTVDITGDGQADRSFVFESDADGDFRIGNGAGLVSGDALWYDGDQNVAWPLGTYTVQEIKAPGGLLLEGQTEEDSDDYQAPVHTFDLTDAGDAASLTLACNIEEPVDMIEIGVEKVDSDRLDIWEGDTTIDAGIGQGNGTLEGCRIAFDNAGDTDILYDDDLYEPGARVTSVETNAQGLASLELMVGRYEVYEIAPPVGYMSNPQHYLLTVTPTGNMFEEIN